MTESIIFDRRAVRNHRGRAARALSAEFLFEAALGQLADRLDDIKRSFPCALVLGARDGLARRLLKGAGGIELLVEADESVDLIVKGQGGRRLAAEAETLPFSARAFDLVLSPLSLHWANDLPGALIQLRHCLKPDGLLLAAMLGGETLIELRRAFLEAETIEEEGATPRVSPMADARALGGLLQRAGFALPVIDSDRLTVTYQDAFALMKDLRAMGETNALIERRKGFSRRSTLMRMAQIYRDQFAEDGERIRASFEIITLTAWVPHESQPKPLRPGSATVRLADALSTEEKPAGDKALPGR